ncbi:sperm axonemal maintenance protein CFAP97D1 isoform X2 [Entelurus aequoreus]|nr:sperm axonemal maintenance protein CFAP97D1 isoform X2 [Entelurus aequoreus]
MYANKLPPVSKRYLQDPWDYRRNYQLHRTKVSFALPVVDTKGTSKPVHMQRNLKKQQLQDERRATIERDNLLLASSLARIEASRGLLDHKNQYQPMSLNADKRRAELLLVSRQNLNIYQRITARQSEYRRQLWMSDWEKAEKRRVNISRYPQGPKQKSNRKLKFAGVEENEETTH